jgi:hypothetical protein
MEPSGAAANPLCPVPGIRGILPEVSWLFSRRSRAGLAVTKRPYLSHTGRVRQSPDGKKRPTGPGPEGCDENGRRLRDVGEASSLCPPGRSKARSFAYAAFLLGNSCASKSASANRVRKAGPRPLVGLVPWDRDNLKLIVWGPIPNEQGSGRSLPIRRRLESSGDFRHRLRIPSANELEEKRKQFHKNFRLVPSVPVTPGLDFFLCFQELNGEVLLQFHRVSWLSVVR